MNTAQSFYIIKIMIAMMDEVTITVALLTLAVVLMVVVYIMLVLTKKNKLRKLKDDRDPKDIAYNQMQMLKSMINVLKDKGYNTASGESMLQKAQKAYNAESYAECIEIVESAKRMIYRLKNENNIVEDRVSPQVEKEMEIIKKIDSTSENSDLPTPLRELEKDLPQNFLQSKFEIRVVEEKLLKYEDGDIKEAAMLYLSKAKDAFKNKEYTDALRLAIKSNRIIDTGEIPEPEHDATSTDAPTPPPPTKEVVNILEEEEEVKAELHCPQCGAVVRPEDKFCWNCGAKLVYHYKCPNCGAEVSSEDKFCRNCGYKLK